MLMPSSLSSLFTVQGVSYELYATVDHVGSLRGGHYTATIQSPDDGGSWFNFNDYVVTPVSLPFLWQTLAIVSYSCLSQFP